MKRRTIVVYWLLLLIPTMIVGLAAFRFLRHESERVRQRARSSAEDRVRTIADSLKVAISAVEEELTEQLRSIPAEGTVEALIEWQETSPLVRNVFVWHEADGLLYPVHRRTSTSEERRFVARYDALFAGRVPWRRPVSDQAQTRSQVLVAQGAARRHEPQQSAQMDEFEPGFIEEVIRLRGTRYEMARAARRKGKSAKWREEIPDAQTGWVPWFTENRLSLLAWLQPPASPHIHGIELEFMALLSRLVAVFPTKAPNDTTFAILNGADRVVHQAGSLEIEEGQRPDVSLSLSPYLPHWSVAAFFSGGLPGAAGGSTFMLLSGLLLAIFLAAILLGGALLARVAHLNMLDAARKTTFVSNVSHELKTPLTSIRMYAELLTQKRVRDEQKQEKYLGVIATESERLTRLVNNVLDFSRLEQGRKKYRPADIELTGFVGRFVESNRLRIEESGLRIETDIPSGEITVRMDRDALEQVLLNLADNATKYAALGAELRISVAARPDGVELRVADRGPGIPPRHRGRIFDKFHRVDDSLTAEQPGSGLGLSIARNMLRDLGGDLLFEDRQGGGSCFVIRLPARLVVANATNQGDSPPNR